MNPNLFEAKKEYTKQLADILTPYVFTTIARIFEANRSKFRDSLRDVPNWNAGMIADKTQEIVNKYPQLQNLITAACVSYTKMLGSIRLNTRASSNVRVTIPEVGPFIHSVYIYVAREFFYEPATLLKASRRMKHELVEDAIAQATREHVPIDQLLDAYLSPAVDTEGIDPFAASYENDHDEQEQQDSEGNAQDNAQDNAHENGAMDHDNDIDIDNDALYDMIKRNNDTEESDIMQIPVSRHEPQAPEPLTQDGPDHIPEAQQWQQPQQAVPPSINSQPTGYAPPAPLPQQWTTPHPDLVPATTGNTQQTMPRPLFFDDDEFR